MAVTIRLFNNNTQLASKEIPDGAVTRVQALFPAATAALSAGLFLAALWPLARLMLFQRGAQAVVETQATANNAAHVAYEAAFNTEVPEPV